MKSLSINITDEDFAHLAALANVLDITPERYVETEGMDWMIEGMEGNVADNLVCRIWDTLAEAQVAAGKADTLDETSYFWHFYKMPDGRIIVEDSGRNQDKLVAAGHKFVTSGLSQDWKEAA